MRHVCLSSCCSLSPALAAPRCRCAGACLAGELVSASGLYISGLASFESVVLTVPRPSPVAVATSPAGMRCRPEAPQARRSLSRPGPGARRRGPGARWACWRATRQAPVKRYSWRHLHVNAGLAGRCAGGRSRADRRPAGSGAAVGCGACRWCGSAIARAQGGERVAELVGFSGKLVRWVSICSRSWSSMLWRVLTCFGAPRS